MLFRFSDLYPHFSGTAIDEGQIKSCKELPVLVNTITHRDLYRTGQSWVENMAACEIFYNSG